MKNKKIIMYIIIIILMLFIFGMGILIMNNKNKKNDFIQEYIPSEEISDEQLRKTNIILYFKNKTTGELSTEIRQIDSKLLLKNPENKLIEYLLNGPEEENLERLIPEKTELISTELINGILNINFSEDFLENKSENEINEIKESILNTTKQLNEINEIKILINGKEI